MAISNLSKMIIYTYVIGHYNPSFKIIDLVSHTTYIVCVNFIHKWRNLQFKVDSERQIFWETFNGSFNLLSEFLPEICWEDVTEEIFSFWCLTWGLNRSFTFNKQCDHFSIFANRFGIFYFDLFANFRFSIWH